MTRRPALDKSSVLPFRAERTGERIFVRELAKFLRVHGAEMLRVAKRMRVYHPGSVYREWAWVTPLGAMRLIAYFRAKQEATYETGSKKRFHERLEVLRRHRQKKLARRAAGRDAEPQRGRAQSDRAAGEAVAETPAVSGNDCPTARR